jgi:hypothetical protein
MGRGYGVGNAVRYRHAAHFDGDFPGFGAVVNLGQNVGVDVNHARRLDQIRSKDSKAKDSISCLHEVSNSRVCISQHIFLR